MISYLPPWVVVWLCLLRWFIG